MYVRATNSANLQQSGVQITYDTIRRIESITTLSQKQMGLMLECASVLPDDPSSEEKLSNLADGVGATMLPVARSILGEDADTLLEAFPIGVRSWSDHSWIEHANEAWRDICVKACVTKLPLSP